MIDDAMEQVLRVKRAREAEWLALEGVAAVGVGLVTDGRPGVVVSVESDTARLRGRIPAEVDGVPVEIRVSGPMRAG